MAKDGNGKPVRNLSLLDFDLVAFAFLTGLRQGEQFGLLWEQVDFANHVLKIPESKDGKHRFVPLNQAALDVLRRQRLLHDGKSRWVFPGERKSDVPRNAHNFTNRVFRPALKRARMKDFVFHDLRHTYGSRLAMAGVPLLTIAELMGHANPNMTKRYAHLCPSHLKQAVYVLCPGHIRIAVQTLGVRKVEGSIQM